MDKYIGKRLDGRYEIHELIGVGGMANVYRCTDTLDDREVAIKILKDEFLDNEEFSRRFKNESKAIAMLSHPNIVKVYDVSFGDMIQYIVMEYIDGITLKEYIEQQGIIEWRDTIHLITQVLKALQHAHECGIVHRDVKPQNIMLLQDGTIKMTDFGIARFSDKATRTMTDQAIGSVHYIAPEQARGDSTDGKTDIYSVGIMLYEMLTGQLPFNGDSAVTIALMHIQDRPKNPRRINPSIPIGLEQITMRAMQKEPSERYASAAEMLSDIERFRLNPSIVFDYRGAFVDNQPTKYVRSLKDTADEGNRVDRKKIDDDDRNNYADDDVIKEHSTFYYAMKGVLIAAILVCAAFFVLAAFKGCDSTQTRDVDVPNFVGKMLVDVKENNPDNFQFEINSKYDESKEIGVILSQEPQAGSMKIKSGSTISLTVNGTDTEVTVPFITNSAEADLTSLLKEKSLIPHIVYVENAKTPKGYAIDSFPKAGSKTTIGSTVYVYISNGTRTENVTIPSIIGTTLSEAQAKLTELGLTVETVYDDESKEPKDTVLSSSPLPYGKVEKGTVVSLNVSSGKGDKRKATINIEMPTGVEGSVEMTVIVDGAVDSSNSKTIVPSLTSSYSIELEGSGTSTVVIQLNGSTYREYSVDFSTGAATLISSNPFAEPTTVPQEEPTPDPTDYVPVTEPVTDPPLDPGTETGD